MILSDRTVQTKGTDALGSSNLKKFCESLSTCIPLTHHMKFDSSKIRNTQISYCLLCSNMMGWRTNNDLTFVHDNYLCFGKKRDSQGLDKHINDKHNEGMYYKEIYYHLMKLTVIWNNHNKKIIKDRSSHKHTDIKFR